MMDHIKDAARAAAREAHCRYCGIDERHKCPDDVDMFTDELVEIYSLLKELADDTRVDLVDSERRIRLYSILHKAGLL